MKRIFALFLVFPLLASAQDSCKVKKTTDAFTKETRLSTGFVPFVSNGVQLYISIDATKTEIDFFLWVRNDAKCFDSESSVQINFEGDRLKSTYRNTGSMNCEGAFHFNFRNSASVHSNLRRLMEKKVSSIKFTGSGKAVTEVSLSEEQKQQLQRMTTCLVNEAKALPK